MHKLDESPDHFSLIRARRATLIDVIGRVQV